MVATTRSKRTATTTTTTAALARKARTTTTSRNKKGASSAAPAASKTSNGIQKFTRTVKAGSAASTLPSKGQDAASAKSKRQVQRPQGATKEKFNTEDPKPSPPVEKDIDRQSDTSSSKLQPSPPSGHSQTAKPKPLAPSKKSPPQPQSRPAKPNPKSKNSATTETRKSSLLVRLLEKQAHLASQPPPPTKAEKLRTAAEQRVPEILSILSLMKPQPPPLQKNRKTVAPSRRPYSFDVVVQNVRQSVRSPIEKDVVVAGLDIIANSESSGKWVSIVTVNQVKSVVLTTHGGQH